MPNGRSYMGRSRQGAKTPEKPQSGYEIQEGPPPARVGTRFTENAYGLIGDDVNSFPTNQSDIYIPNIPVVRNPRVPASRAGIPGVDNTAYIPAFAVGDPR